MPRFATALAGALLMFGCGGDGAAVAVTARPASDAVNVSASTSVAANESPPQAGLATSDSSALAGSGVDQAAAPPAVAGGDPTEGDAKAAPVPIVERVPEMPSPPETAIDLASLTAELRKVVDEALADAARRTGLPVDSLAVTRAEAVVWPDGSLGCPEPGVLYTMALVPGYRIRIDAQGAVMVYHASQRGQMVLCPLGRAVESLPAGTT